MPRKESFRHSRIVQPARFKILRLGMSGNGELLGQTYPRELARLLNSSLSATLKGVASLERDGLVAGRLVEAAPDLDAKVAEFRRRPRRTGKRL